MIKSRKKSKEEIEAKKSEIQKMRELFFEIWKERPIHKCENCSKFLGYEPLTYMFEHRLEKSKYPQLKYEKDNIKYSCLDCHSRKSSGFLSPLEDMQIKQLKKQFNIL